LGIYAGEDDWINSGLPAIVESMVRYKKTFAMKLYSGVQHAFFNEAMPTYNKQRQRTLGRWQFLSLANI
jgi:dienelactone hydrolase